MYSHGEFERSSSCTLQFPSIVGCGNWKVTTRYFYGIENLYVIYPYEHITFLIVISSRFIILFKTRFLLLFLHNSHGTKEIPNCGNLVRPDWVGNLRWDNMEPYEPFRWVNTEPSVQFRKANTNPSVQFRKANTDPSMQCYAMLCHVMAYHVLCHGPCAIQRHLAPETKSSARRRQ